MKKDFSISHISIDDPNDLRFVFDCRAHTDVVDCLIGAPPQSFDMHVNWINSHIGKDREMFIVFDCDGQRMGYSQLYNFTDTTVEIGWVLHPSFHGRGLGTTLGTLSLRKAANLYPSHTIVGTVLKTNPTALHLDLKLGFRIESQSEEYVYVTYDKHKRAP